MQHVHTVKLFATLNEKPKVPVHAVLTAKNPLIRFIGSDDMTQNRELFQVWLQKLAQWHQTTTPYLFYIRQILPRPGTGTYPVGRLT